MEKVTGCPLCGSSRFRTRDRLIPILRSVYTASVPTECRECGLGFMWPIPKTSDTGDVYEAEYFDAYKERDIPMPAASAIPPARYLARLQFVSTRTGLGQLLEVGPGTGAFLKYAKDTGWRVQAIETSRYAAAALAERFGSHVRAGTLLTTPVPSESVDVVHMSHVLEHMNEPLANLKVVHRALKPGGSVIIEVPNELRSLQFRVLSAAKALQPYTVRSSHIFFFTPSTLRSFLEKAGFTVVHLASVRDLENASALRRNLRRAAAAVERRIDGAPLIEAIAVK